MHISSLFRRVALLGALALLGAGLTAGSAASATTKTVKVELVDFEVLPAATSVKAGKITFAVANTGLQTHGFVVLKTDRPAGKLPVAGGKASEKGKVGQIASIASEKASRLALTLKPGKYVLISNRSGDYDAGMYAAFTVKK